MGNKLFPPAIYIKQELSEIAGRGVPILQEEDKSTTTNGIKVIDGEVGFIAYDCAF